MIIHFPFYLLLSVSASTRPWLLPKIKNALLMTYIWSLGAWPSEPLAPNLMNICWSQYPVTWSVSSLSSVLRRGDETACGLRCKLVWVFVKRAMSKSRCIRLVSNIKGRHISFRCLYCHLDPATRCKQNYSVFYRGEDLPDENASWEMGHDLADRHAKNYTCVHSLILNLRAWQQSSTFDAGVMPLWFDSIDALWRSLELKCRSIFSAPSDNVPPITNSRRYSIWLGVHRGRSMVANLR